MPSIIGGLSLSGDLVASLKGHCPIIAIQALATAENMETFRDMCATATCFVSAMRSYQAHGPYALAGYSYGGRVAFEVACVLSELGEEVDLLAIIDTGPGFGGLKAQSGDRWRRLSNIALDLPVRLREEIRQFSASQFVKRAWRKTKRFYRLVASGGRARIEVDDVLDASRLPSQTQEFVNASLTAIRDHVPRPYAGRVTLFRAATLPFLSGLPHDFGWGRFTHDVDVRLIGGTHGTILKAPHVEKLTTQFAELLDKRAARAHPGAGGAGPKASYKSSRRRLRTG
jgi:thioesterase domain-containing protein